MGLGRSGYHRVMVRLRGPICALTLLLTACDASGTSVSPDVRQLCGTWTSDAGASERWDIDGDNLVGQGRSGEEVEQLALLAGSQGHIYVAQPGRAAPTEFRPIDPSAARFSVDAPASARVWVWANYDHDFPQEIHYALLPDEGRLEAAIVGPGEGGEARVMAWTFARTAGCVVVS